jgi:AraC-like DNA-binding protein
MSGQDEIIVKFLSEIDKHLDDLVKGKVDDMFEINEFAKILHVHPVHFSALVKRKTAKTPCHFYQERILETARTLLQTTEKPISEIAFMLTYDPSNFTKIFKRYTGLTPGQFRKKIVMQP